MKRARCTVWGCERVPPKGRKRCDECRAHLTRLERVRIAKRRKVGLCKCGRKRSGKFKQCRLCRGYFNGRLGELRKERLAAKVCTMCASPDLAWRVLTSGERVQLTVCENHREVGVSDAKRERDGLKRKQAIAKKRCTNCSSPAYFDPVANVYRRLCLEHLEMLRERQQRWYERQQL